MKEICHSLESQVVHEGSAWVFLLLCLSGACAGGEAASINRMRYGTAA